MRKSRYGFTRLEVLVALVLLAMLAILLDRFLVKPVREQQAKAVQGRLDRITSAPSARELQPLVDTSLCAPDLLRAGAKQIADDSVTGEKRFVLTSAGIGKPVLVVLNSFGTVITRIKLYDPKLEGSKTCPRYLRVTLELPIGRDSKVQLAGFVGDECEYTPTELAKRLAGPVKFKAGLKVPQGKRTAELALRMTAVKAVPALKAEAQSGR